MIERVSHLNEMGRTKAQAARAEMTARRRSMGRFAEQFSRLPFRTVATCPACGRQVTAEYRPHEDGVVVCFKCDHCGPTKQFHHDAIYTERTSDRPGSPTHTYAGQSIRPVVRDLPRTVETLCPTCLAVIVGRIFVENGAVWMEKTCPDHGYVRDCINRDARLYAKAMHWTFEEHAGAENPACDVNNPCPGNCGLCGQHQSLSCLANIDLTNRCNMNCPICFANSNAAGYVYEPSYDQVVEMLQQLRSLRPRPATAVQFSGGEPTLHPDFHRIIAAANEMGFSHIQIATNGITHANLDFARRSAEAGLHTLYLQFDGVGDEAYQGTRNFPGIWAKKLACIENVRETGMKLCLVPTIVRGVNDDQVGPILHFACRNADVISGLSWQPVSFTGRIDPNELSERRYTLGDLAHDIADACGSDPLRDMYPLSIVVPLSQMIEALTGEPKIRPSCHPDCAFGTYLLVDPEGKPHPFPEVIDVEGMFSDMNRIARRIEQRGRATWLDKIRIVRMFKRHWRAKEAPAGLSVKRFVSAMLGCVDKNVGRTVDQSKTYRTIMSAGMHFQDAYNYDVERVKRCVILYSTPEGVFPFCTINCGPSYRGFIERIHARGADQPAEPLDDEAPTDEIGVEVEEAQ